MGDRLGTNSVIYDLSRLMAFATPPPESPPASVYGGMYADNISQSVTISVIDTHYEVGGGISGGNTSGVTFQNAKELKILTAGVYLITYSISIQCASANQEVEASVMVNSTSSARLSSHALVTPANTPNVLAGSQPITLAVNDVVKFCLANHTATNNLTVSHANMSILLVGS